MPAELLQAEEQQTVVTAAPGQRHLKRSVLLFCCVDMNRWYAHSPGKLGLWWWSGVIVVLEFRVCGAEVVACYWMRVWC